VCSRDQPPDHDRARDHPQDRKRKVERDAPHHATEVARQQSLEQTQEDEQRVSMDSSCRDLTHSVRRDDESDIASLRGDLYRDL
jgi:hypothetical protein